ncbi:MAG: amino acid ABC transporter permease [Ardenticatenales bacterium]|nr:amino acid ABC transporter permease [Ardenticatenales bacterium]
MMTARAYAIVRRHGAWWLAAQAALTILAALLVWWTVPPLLRWLWWTADWSVVTANLRLFILFRYPTEAAWRPALALAMTVAAVGLAVRRAAARQSASGARTLLWLLGAVLASFVLLRGVGSSVVPMNLWGGLLLTLILAATAIGLSLPLGIVLALGRRSALPLVRWTSVAAIECVRGLPLITILFMASLVVPLALPDAWRPDTVLRAIFGLTLFSAAYVAEDVRGGLNAVGAGQYDAARALGLGSVAMHRLVILPQALRAVVPAIVGQFIALLKDTSLVLILGLTELFGVARSVVNQPEHLGRFREALLFAAVVYFVLCGGLSRVSRSFEMRGRESRRGRAVERT